MDDVCTLLVAVRTEDEDEIEDSKGTVEGTECSCHEDYYGIRRTIWLTGSNQPSIYAMDIDTGRRIAQLLE